MSRSLEEKYEPGRVSGMVDELCINTIRTLSIDAVQKANSGHPGMPMGASTMAYILWTRTSVTIREIPPGRTAIDSCSRPGTPACSSTACCS
jgi:hypothetical protein